MDEELQEKEIYLSPGLKLRAVEFKDVKAVAQLILEVCTADGDPTLAVTAEELERSWQTPGFDPGKDAWVVEEANGRILGYEEFTDRHAHASLMGDGYVHPDFHDQGIGTAMLRALEQRAREEMEAASPDTRVYIRNGMITSDNPGRRLHENEGYHPIRFSWRMEIKLEAPAPEPVWPGGVSLRPFIFGEHDRLVYEADEEAFQDHWGHNPTSYERWQHHLTGRPDFDPALWFIAWDGDEIAGFSLCRYRKEIGWVNALGVRRPWRKRGLGQALLQHSFGEFYRRGRHTIGLGVDAANPTGATRLYQKAGMQVANEYVIYEKELRPGRRLE